MFGSLSQAAAEKVGSILSWGGRRFQNSPPNGLSSALARPTSRTVRLNKLKLSCLAGWSLTPPPQRRLSFYRYETSQQKRTLQKSVPRAQPPTFQLLIMNKATGWVSSWPRGNVRMEHQRAGRHSPASKSSQRVRDWVQIARGGDYESWGGGSSLTFRWTGNFSLTLSMWTQLGVVQIFCLAG